MTRKPSTANRRLMVFVFSAFVACGGQHSTSGDASTRGEAPGAQASDAQISDAQAPDARAPDAQPPDGPLPAWAKDKPLFEWFEIPNTQGGGGSAFQAYSGMALKATTSELIVAAAGGHGDSADNRVVSIRLDRDTPTWELRSPPSTEVQKNVAYYPDGKPSSRHTYGSTHYVPQVNRVMLLGALFTYGSGHTFDTVDGFDLETNTWDPAGTWPNGGTGSALDPATGNVWATGSRIRVWSPVTRTTTVTAEPGSNRFFASSCVWDPVRNQLVTIGFGDSWGTGNFPTLNAYIIDATGKNATPLSFNASPGYNQFLEDKPLSAAFDYDERNDQFVYFDGRHDGEHGPSNDGGRIYVIKPNAGTTWDVSILPLGPGTQNPPMSLDAGVFSRLRYVPRLRGFAYLCASSWERKENIYFIRTAP